MQNQSEELEKEIKDQEPDVEATEETPEISKNQHSLPSYLMNIEVP